MEYWTVSIIKMGLLCGTIFSCFALVMFTRRKPRQPDAALEQISARLERIEQAVDAIAIEVERVSEGQRFTSKLLAERELPARIPAKQITPH